MTTVNIKEIMAESGVGFGTSGARGLALSLTDRVAYATTAAFLQHLQANKSAPSLTAVAIAGDLRSSTPRIMAAAARAVSDRGLRLINSGFIPSPAVAAYGLCQSIPTIMVTGSHIPDDRNGIKYTRLDGEIMKEDEEGILSQKVTLPADLDPVTGNFNHPPALPRKDPEAERHYAERYVSVFGDKALCGMHLGFYQHSAVGREILPEIYRRLGAKVTLLGWSETFLPVDTEAIRREDAELAAGWAATEPFTAILSTDGDSDRPLLSDEEGRWLRGDVAGILTAQFLKADTVITPVSSNSAVERCGSFRRVIRSRIGSPYVIAEMKKASEAGNRIVAGYEANGGFLLNSPVTYQGRTLPPLPTRDATLVHLAVLLIAREHGLGVDALCRTLPARYTASDRLRDFPQERAAGRLAIFSSGSALNDHTALEGCFGEICGRVEGVDRTDGLRITFSNEEVIHLRMSGNAPELRCYTEAESEARAVAIAQKSLTVMEGWR